MNSEFHENNLNNLKSIEYLGQNSQINEILKELKYYSNKNDKENSFNSINSSNLNDGNLAENFQKTKDFKKSELSQESPDSQRSLKDKLLTINNTSISSNREFSTKENLLNSEIIASKKFDFQKDSPNNNEINLEMINFGEDKLLEEEAHEKRRFKRQKTKINYLVEENEEEIRLSFDKKSPIVFHLNTSDMNYIGVWNKIKKFLLFICVVIAFIFHIMIPMIVKKQRK